MTLSVNTNQPALIAVQNLNRTNDQMQATQTRINTGESISTAKDNAAVWSIAQEQRADMSALGAVKMSLDRATSIADVALAAGESVSDLLKLMREKVPGRNSAAGRPCASAKKVKKWPEWVPPSTCTFRPSVKAFMKCAMAPSGSGSVR